MEPFIVGTVLMFAACYFATYINFDRLLSRPPVTISKDDGPDWDPQPPTK